MSDEAVNLEKELDKAKKEAESLFVFNKVGVDYWVGQVMPEVRLGLHWGWIARCTGEDELTLMAHLMSNDSGNLQMLTLVRGPVCLRNDFNKGTSWKLAEKVLENYDGFKQNIKRELGKLKKIDEDMRAMGYYSTVKGKYFRIKSGRMKTNSVWFYFWGLYFQVDEYKGKEKLHRGKFLPDLNQFVPMVLEEEREILENSENKELEWTEMPPELRMALVEAKNEAE